MKVKKFLSEYFLAVVGVVYVFLFIPYNLNNLLPFYSALVFIYIFFLLLYKKKGAPFIVISLACIMPCFSSNGSEGVFDYYVQWLFYAIRISCIFIIFCRLNKITLSKRHLPFMCSIVFLFLVILLLQLFYENNPKDFILGYLSTYLFLFICYNEKVKIQLFYFFLSWIFLFTFCYAILEYHFSFCPYNIVYFLFLDTDVYRAKGLLGHPLILCEFALFYSSILFIKMYISNVLKKSDLLLYVLCLYLLLITGSRTALFGGIIELIIFFTFSYRRYKLNKIILFLCGFGMLLFLFYFFNIDKFDYLYGRFSDGAEHREAGFSTVFSMFHDNIYGVGPQNVGKKMFTYAKTGLLQINTLDNTYLTLLGGYGVFCVFPFINLFLPLIYSFFKKEKNYIFVFCMLYIPLFAVGFSFDFESYILVSLLYYGSSGFFMRYLDEKGRKYNRLGNKKNNHACNNNC